MSIPIVIVDPHLSYRNDLAVFLTLLNARYKVVGVASTAREATEAVCTCAPELVLIDVDLPDSNGIILTQRLHQRFPMLPIIVLGNDPDVNYRLAALNAGALAYVDKLEIGRALPSTLSAILDPEPRFGT